jgi:5-bromo-4-chloroindolyl phosphate hydrolysis protein
LAHYLSALGVVVVLKALMLSMAAMVVLVVVAAVTHQADQLVALHHLGKVLTAAMESITHLTTTQVAVVVVKLQQAQQQLRQVLAMVAVELLTSQRGVLQLLLVKMSGALTITQVAVVELHRKLAAQL